ncbi:MAG: hypothetical protein ACF8MJ_12290 [Phycisphaerales bacterium JB050]
MLRTLAIAIALAPTALAQHADIDLSLGEDNDGTTRIVTGISDFQNPDQPIIRGVRVFSSTTGEGGIPGFTDDPGFNALEGELPAGALLGFDLVDALRIWNGNDFENLSDDPMRVSLFTISRLTPDEAGGFTEGFDFATIGSNGAVHSHINYRLEAPETPGIFLLTIQLRIDTPGIEPSLPVFIVFNNNADPEQAETAAAYLEALLEPETCPADVTGDNAVNLADLNLVLAHFGQTTTDGDTNDDGQVDLADLNTVLAAFGQTCP